MSTLDQLFEPKYLGDQDTDTHRVCGTCGELKPVSEFYKDGRDSKGNVKYRRDCRDCYKQTRVEDARRKEKHKNGNANK